MILGNDLLKDKSPIMMYPSMKRIPKHRLKSKVNASTNTNPEGKHPIVPDHPDAHLLGIKSISNLRSITRNSIQKNIHEFITQKKEKEALSNSQVNLKSYYLGHFKNPSFLHSIDTNYESLNFNNDSKNKFGCFNLMNHLNKKCALNEDAGVSGCGSPKSDDLSIENNKQCFRFMTKDSYEDLDKLNVDMASKVKLLSRSGAPQDTGKVKQQDKEIRSLRRSQEQLKSMKERSIIRYHKHRKTTNQLSYDDPNKIGHGSGTPYIGTYTAKSGGYRSLHPRTALIQSDGDKKILLIDDYSTFEANQNIDRINSNDYGFFLQSKYDKAQIDRIANKKLPKVQKASNDDSPLKRWKKHARTEGQSRIQLISHVNYS
jgi:hypothetical protein